MEVEVLGEVTKSQRNEIGRANAIDVDMYGPDSSYREVLELKHTLLEKDAHIVELQRRLEDAQRKMVAEKETFHVPRDDVKRYVTSLHLLLDIQLLTMRSVKKAIRWYFAFSIEDWSRAKSLIGNVIYEVLDESRMQEQEATATEAGATEVALVAAAV